MYSERDIGTTRNILINILLEKMETKLCYITFHDIKFDHKTQEHPMFPLFYKMTPKYKLL